MRNQIDLRGIIEVTRMRETVDLICLSEMRIGIIGIGEMRLGIDEMKTGIDQMKRTKEIAGKFQIVTRLHVKLM